MPHPQFDRHAIHFNPLSMRKNKVQIERDHIDPHQLVPDLAPNGQAVLRETITRIRTARENNLPRILVFGAHTIKNGLSRVLIRLMERGWITHLATNGAGIIHDWEFAFQGETSEDVRANVEKGQFGIWEETGRYLNLAIVIGAWKGFGYGESVGAFVEQEGLQIPSQDDLEAEVRSCLSTQPDQAAAAADLLHIVRTFNLSPGWLSIPHPWKRFGVQSAAFRLGIPFTGHPMIGHDIIYTHPLNHCAAIGRAAQRDFLTYAHSISKLEGGVYLSVGSAVMSPMIFEKSLSMSRNVLLQKGQTINNHYMVIVDLAESHWDWTQGEPPETNPDYFLRYNKTFARMGGVMRYVSADNRLFLPALLQGLEA